jgi:hypothetical protein
MKRFIQDFPRGREIFSLTRKRNQNTRKVGQYMQTRKLLTVMLVVGCVLLGSISASAATKLTVWCQTEHNEVFRRMIGPFEEEYGVTVEFIDIHPKGKSWFWMDPRVRAQISFPLPMMVWA